MSPSDAMVYYPLFVAVIALIFNAGIGYQRMRTIEREIRDLKDGADGAMQLRDRLTRVETLLEGFTASLGALQTGMESVQRQLGGIASRGAGGRAEVIGLGLGDGGR